MPWPGINAVGQCTHSAQNIVQRFDAERFHPFEQFDGIGLIGERVLAISAEHVGCHQAHSLQQHKIERTDGLVIPVADQYLSCAWQRNVKDISQSAVCKMNDRSKQRSFDRLGCSDDDRLSHLCSIGA
ncbi:hypothetical protein WT08_00980 [Burkholderia sp. MSMB1552]|nr:hypothetical protein WT08_00980 [Burkholderia sp. MSMB1552]KWZ56313.1 hypothetical protein WS92_10700 [Burkholderia sp. MSMB1588]